jgi:hypothetical protein
MICQCQEGREKGSRDCTAHLSMSSFDRLFEIFRSQQQCLARWFHPRRHCQVIGGFFVGTPPTCTSRPGESDGLWISLSAQLLSPLHNQQLLEQGYPGELGPFQTICGSRESRAKKVSHRDPRQESLLHVRWPTSWYLSKWRSGCLLLEDIQLQAWECRPWRYWPAAPKNLILLI